MSVKPSSGWNQLWSCGCPLNGPCKLSRNLFISCDLSSPPSSSHLINPRSCTVNINFATDQCTSQARFRSMDTCTHIHAHAHMPFDRIALHRIMINLGLSMLPVTSSFQFETISCATAVDLRRDRETRSLIPEIGNRKPAYPTFFAEIDFACKMINMSRRTCYSQTNRARFDWHKPSVEINTPVIAFIITFNAKIIFNSICYFALRSFSIRLQVIAYLKNVSGDSNLCAVLEF